MRNSHLENRPIIIGPHDWYYEERGALEVIHQVTEAGIVQKTDHIHIPWRKVIASAHRKEQDVTNRRRKAIGKGR